METHENATGHTNTSHSPSKFVERITFFFVAMGVITLTYGLFVLVDFIPEAPKTKDTVPGVANTTDFEKTESISSAVTKPASTEALPVKIIFDSLGNREVPVMNPTSSDITVLNTALLSGALRHPESADLLHEGTMYILAHSTYLPNIKNPNYKAFNDIQKLKWGDIIRVQSKDLEYVYSVEREYEAKASTGEVPLQSEKAKLVLSTCNTFGTKDDRFIVEATLVMKRAIPS